MVVVLHGNYDRPEWECAVWRKASALYGWTLCPRGVPRPGAPPKEDRWTYAGRAQIVAEIDASLQALQARYPGQVDTSPGSVVLAGFSLGAIHAPAIALEQAGRYRAIALVEGDQNKLTPQALRRLEQAGVRDILLAASAPGSVKLAQRLTARAMKAGVRVTVLAMPGAGHGYSRDFAIRAAPFLLGLDGDTPDP